MVGHTSKRIRRGILDIRRCPNLVCNGLKISNGYDTDTDIGWPKESQLLPPGLAVLDSSAKLPLTTQRYELSQNPVPFINDLVLDVTLSYIAHALVCGPTSPKEALSFHTTHPLAPKFTPYIGGLDTSLFTKGYLRWCVPLEWCPPILISILLLV